ncbi:hypothetical protein [Chondrinema litorale]|uniref:hypothetical protein n=1 Tax=Chondrinema litorale TaxID=2994555 RepID=UPI0025428351|nr:hypothetical protein [Chondrinema litorale]UZR99569.1 hypothetical protein OQ292_37540 [Chondrinema litorale]
MMALSELVNAKHCISPQQKVIQEKSFTYLLNYNNHSLSLEWRIINYKPYLYFKFKGILSTETSIEGIQLWTEIIKRHSNKISQIWDCSQMDAYESKARNHWQNALVENHTEIDEIFLIANSSIAKIFGQTITINTPIKVKIISKESDIIKRIKLS